MKPNIALSKASDKAVTIVGNELNVEWLDSYILVWSGVEHPYKK